MGPGTSPGGKGYGVLPGTGGGWVCALEKVQTNRANAATKANFIIFILDASLRAQGYAPHRRSTSSEQKPGPIAARSPHVPGAGRQCCNVSSKTNKTEAEDRLPVLRRQLQETSRARGLTPSAASVASSTLGPPV